MKNRMLRSVVLVVLALLAIIAVQARSLAQEAEPHGGTSVQAALGTTFTYQGQLKSGGEPITAPCTMAFRLYDDATAGSQVGSAITSTVPITGGLFTANLDFGRDVFGGDARWLGIRVNCPGDSGYVDLGRQALTAVPYALYAARSGGPENVVTVARSGGDYTSVQAAIDSIGDAAADNAYLVWIAPGRYSETVTLKPYVHLQGAGQEATIISSAAGNETWPPTEGTLVLAASTSLRDLTVGNGGAFTHSVALLATDGTTQTLVANVTVLARASGAGSNQAIYLTGSDTSVTLLNVTALAENDSSYNYGLNSGPGAVTTVHGGSFTARGGERAWGILSNSSSGLVVEDVMALGENGRSNYGLFNFAVAKLSGGSFTARGGTIAVGIQNYEYGEMEAEGVVALAENGDDETYGLSNTQGSSAVLRGGSFTARGGSEASGILNGDSGSELRAEGVTALAEGGSNNYGLYNCWAGAATLHGGSFTGRGGSSARGIWNDNPYSTLEAENVAVLSEEGGINYGLHNDNGATAALRGGSFIARGGNSARGVYTHGATSHVDAERVTIRGENSTSLDRGLECSVAGTSDVTQSVLEGATSSVGTTGGGGPCVLSNSRLVGGPATGNVYCTAMSRGTTFNPSGCP